MLPTSDDGLNLNSRVKRDRVARGVARRSVRARCAALPKLLDACGVIRYEGGIDTDRTHLTDDATPYVRGAIDDLLGGRPVRVAAGTCLGCALERW